LKSTASAKNAVSVPSDGLVDISALLVEVAGHITAPTHIAANTEPQSKPANPAAPTAIVNGNSSGEAPERLNLAEFGVTRFEYKTETEPQSSPVLQSVQMLQMVRAVMPAREIKPLKPGSGFESLLHDASSETASSNRPPIITRPAEVQRVQLLFEPPPPPPVVRSVSMDIGDPESQVRVVIRERNGSLNVQLGSTNERLREDLQAAGPMLMRELQRNNPMSVTLDFSNFGSATDADHQSRPQSRAKKLLKSDAEFADVVETAYLPAPSSELKSL